MKTRSFILVSLVSAVPMLVGLILLLKGSGVGWLPFFLGVSVIVLSLHPHRSEAEDNQPSIISESVQLGGQ